jgi:NitT/TauT family transport system substrate-binding protein
MARRLGVPYYRQGVTRPPRLRRVLALALLAAAVSLAFGCRPSRDRLVLGSVRIPSSGLVYIAHEAGCFDEERLEVVQHPYSSGRDAITALRRGEVDAAIAYQTPVVLNAFADRTLRIVTTLHFTSRNTHLAARADRGIREVSDLRGKRVGVPLRTNAELFMRTLLAFDGIDPQEVVLIDIAPEDASGAFASGIVDAVAVWSPHVDAAAAALPPAEVVELYSDVYTEMSAIVTREEVRATRARALTKLVRCLRRAEESVEAAPDRGLAGAHLIFTEIDGAALRRQWSDNTLQLGLSNLLLAIMYQEMEWLRASGEEGDVPPLSTMFAPEFLDVVHPDSVTYLRRE